MDWSMPVNMKIFGMCIVDVREAFSKCNGERCTMSQCEFYVQLAEELIDNSLDSTNFCRRAPVGQQSSAMENGWQKAAWAHISHQRSVDASPRMG
eukprot:IDg22332t1